MSLGQGTTASTDQMVTFAKSADNAAGNLTTTLTTMLSSLSPLDGWIGDGGTSFQSTKITVEAEMKRLYSALTGISSDISGASVNYVQSDGQQKSEMTSVESQTTGITSSLVIS